jgi:hypothetical protein
MSSAGALGGSGARGPGGSGGRKHGRPLGSLNKVKDLAATLPVSCKRSRPLGSRNKKTLAALAAVAATVSAEAAPATATAAVSGEAAAAAATAAAAAGDLPSAVAGAARKSGCPPEKHRLTYTSANGYTTFLAPLRDGCEVRLPLPFRFVDTMGGSVPTHAIMEECSGGQPLYPIEIFHDGEGKSYLHDGWPKFIEDYNLKLGWSLIFTHRIGSHFFCVRVVDNANFARAYSAWA